MVNARSAPAGVIIGRLLLLLAAGAALVAGAVSSPEVGAASPGSAPRFVCPMHPQVVSATPGDCPICNMALERTREGSQAGSIMATHRAVQELEPELVAQTVRAPAWIGSGGVLTAVIHRESVEGLEPGAPAVFFRSAEPARAIPVHRTPDAAAAWDPATVQVRFAAEGTLRPTGDTGWIELAPRPRALLVVPESSVLYASDGAYVLAAPPGGRAFTRRPIQVGRTLDSGYMADRAAERLGGIVVLAGLRPGDRVVTADTFVLDAERRLRAARGQPAEILE